jgi:type III secretion protein J
MHESRCDAFLLSSAVSMLRARPILLVASLALSACSVELQHDLTEDDANDIYVLLQRNGINATKDKDEAGGNEIRYKITVAKGDVASAAQLLRDYSLPRLKAKGKKAFRDGKGMIPTATEERAMFMEAIEGDVINALNKVPGVLEAQVIIQIPEINDLTTPDKKPLPSASVMIKYRNQGDAKGPPLDDKAVAKFVAGAVAELPADRVNVIFTQAARPEAETNPEERDVTVLGLRMNKASADQFKVMVGVGAFLLLAMAGLLAFTFIRGGASGNGNGKKRSATSEG